MRRASSSKRASSSSRKTPDPMQFLDEFVADSLGEKGTQVLHSVGDGATDEVIEQSTRLKIAEIRSILNHLHSYGFVEYSREKNMQNGWFTYTWKVNMDRAMQNFLMLKRREHERLRNRLSAEEGTTIYSCRKGCTRLEFERAYENKFKCSSCKCDLRFLDNKQELKRVESKITALETLLANQGTRTP